MFLGIRCRMSRMKTRYRVGNSTPPCGTPYLRVLFLLVLFYLDFGFPVVHLLSSSFLHSPSNTTLMLFQFQALFPHLVKCLYKVNPYCKWVLLVLEGIFNSLRDVGDLVLSRPILPELLLWCDVLFVFKMPQHLMLMRRSISFATQLVSSSQPSTCPCFFQYGNHEGFSPDSWQGSLSPSIIKQLQ